MSATFCFFSPYYRVEDRVDPNKHKMFRYADAFKSQEKEECDKYSEKLELDEEFPCKRNLTPSASSVSRSTTRSSSHRGWQILRRSTFSQFCGEINPSMEEEVYHVWGMSFAHVTRMTADTCWHLCLSVDTFTCTPWWALSVHCAQSTLQQRVNTISSVFSPPTLQVFWVPHWCTAPVWSACWAEVWGILIQFYNSREIKENWVSAEVVFTSKKLLLQWDEELVNNFLVLPCPVQQRPQCLLNWRELTNCFSFDAELKALFKLRKE